jgi:hypothetical protein
MLMFHSAIQSSIDALGNILLTALSAVKYIRNSRQVHHFKTTFSEELVIETTRKLDLQYTNRIKMQIFIANSIFSSAYHHSALPELCKKAEVISNFQMHHEHVIKYQALIPKDRSK